VKHEIFKEVKEQIIQIAPLKSRLDIFFGIND